MVTMKSIAALYFATLALGATMGRVRLPKRASPLEVTIQELGNSGVKATVTNTGSEDLKLMTTGTILDSNAVEKAEIFNGSTCTSLFLSPRLDFVADPKG